MRFGHLEEADHGPVAAGVDDWWGARRVADKLPRRFFRCVRPDYRSRGIGRQLYEMFFDEARRRGRRSVRDITYPVSTGSIGFHTSMGFEILEGDGVEGGVSVHSDYDGDGKDRVVFVREVGRFPTRPLAGSRCRKPTARGFLSF